MKNSFLFFLIWLVFISNQTFAQELRIDKPDLDKLIDDLVSVTKKISELKNIEKPVSTETPHSFGYIELKKNTTIPIYTNDRTLSLVERTDLTDKNGKTITKRDALPVHVRYEHITIDSIFFKIRLNKITRAIIFSSGDQFFDNNEIDLFPSSLNNLENYLIVNKSGKLFKVKTSDFLRFIGFEDSYGIKNKYVQLSTKNRKVILDSL